jgi:type IV secretion system protein VirB10
MSNQNLNINQSPSSITQSGRFASKKPYLIIFGIITLFLIGMIYATAQRGDLKSTRKNENQNSIKSDTTKIDELLKSLSSIRESSIENNHTQKGLIRGEEKKLLLPLKQPQEPKLTDKEKERLAIAKMKQKALLEAITGKTKITSGDIISPLDKFKKDDIDMSNAPNTDLLSSYIKNYSKIGNNRDSSKLSENSSFQIKNEEYLQHSKQKPLSPYELKRGSLIPAVLIGGINSELPGNIIAQVRENVYDTVTGNYLLIPQGAKLIGVYGFGVQYGQTRVVIAFNSIVFPDGQTLNIGAMNGMDQEGYSGFADQVDNHYFKIFGSAFLLGMLSGEINIENGKITFVSGHQGFNTSQTVLEQTAGQMIRKNLNIAPTIKIRNGYRFNIFVIKDMILEPLKQNR